MPWILRMVWMGMDAMDVSDIVDAGMPMLLCKDGMNEREAEYAMDITWYGWEWMLWMSVIVRMPVKPMMLSIIDAMDAGDTWYAIDITYGMDRYGYY